MRKLCVLTLLLVGIYALAQQPERAKRFQPYTGAVTNNLNNFSGRFVAYQHTDDFGAVLTTFDSQTGQEARLSTGVNGPRIELSSDRTKPSSIVIKPDGIRVIDEDGEMYHISLRELCNLGTKVHKRAKD